jgi:hypothetical protein
MKRLLLLLIFSLALSVHISAKRSGVFYVKYNITKYETSEEFKMTVDLYNGIELKDIKGIENMYCYAVLWFSKDECAIIQLDLQNLDPLMPFNDLEFDTFKLGIYSGTQINGNNRKWTFRYAYY